MQILIVDSSGAVEIIATTPVYINLEDYSFDYSAFSTTRRHDSDNYLTITDKKESGQGPL